MSEKTNSTDIRSHINTLIYRSEDKNKIREALVIINECLKNNSQDIEMLFAKGYVYTKLARYISAIEYYDKCIEIDKNKTEKNECWYLAIFFKGYAFKELERYQDALFWIERYKDMNQKKKKPDLKNRDEAIQEVKKNMYLYALVNIGYLYNRLNKFREAIECFNEVAHWFDKIEEDAEYDETIKIIKEIDYTNDNFDSEKLKKILNLYNKVNDPKNEDYRHALLKLEYIKYYQGSLLLAKNEFENNKENKKDIESAEEYLKKCLNINILLNEHAIPDNEYALIKMHEILYEKNKEKTESLLCSYIPKQEWIKMYGNNHKNNARDEGITKYYHGNRLRLFGNNLAAVRLYDEILDSNSTAINGDKSTLEISTKENNTEFQKTDILALFYKSCALNGLAKYEKALECLKKCEEQIDDDIDVLFAIGNTYRRLGEHEESITYFDKCISKDKNDKDAWFHKGNSLNELQRYVEAAICFEQYNKIQEKEYNNEYNNLTDEQKKEIGEYKKSRYYLSKIGCTYMGQRKYIKAIEYFNKARIIEPTFEDEEVTYNEICSFIKLNEKRANFDYFNYEKKDGEEKNIFAKDQTKIIANFIAEDKINFEEAFLNMETLSSIDEKEHILYLINQQYILFKHINKEIESINTTDTQKSKEEIERFICDETKSKDKEINRLKNNITFLPTKTQRTIKDNFMKLHYRNRINTLSDNVRNTLDKPDVLLFLNWMQQSQKFLNEIRLWLEQGKWEKIQNEKKAVQSLPIKAFSLLQEYELVTSRIYFQINELLNKFIKDNPYHEDAILYKSLVKIKRKNKVKSKKAVKDINDYFEKVRHNKKRNANKDIQTKEQKDAVLYKIFLLSKVYLLSENVEDKEKLLEYLTKKDCKDVDIIQLLELFENNGIENKPEQESEILKIVVEKLLDNDDFFKDALKDKVDTSLKDLVEIYKKIYFKSLSIVQELHIDLDCEQFVAHYTKKAVVEKLLLNNSPFRLSSIGSNDLKEGKTLLDYFGIKQPHSNKDYTPFIGCFMFDDNCLNHFRLYGKDANREATGISLKMKSDFFRDEICGTGSTMFTKYESNTPEKLALFRCIYIDPYTKKVISIGQREESSFYKTDDEIKKRLTEEGDILLLQKYASDTNGDFKDILKTKIEKKRKRIDKRVDRYKEIIKKRQDTITEKMENLKTLIEENIDRLDENVLSELLLNLRYLVKADSFKEEQECRIIEIVKASNDHRVEVIDNDMYIEYLPLKDYLMKITFGPKAEGFSSFKNEFLTKGFNDINCVKSEHPIS